MAPTYHRRLKKKPKMNLHHEKNGLSVYPKNRQSTKFSLIVDAATVRSRKRSSYKSTVEGEFLVLSPRKMSVEWRQGTKKRI
jgi:hypothetical protein